MFDINLPTHIAGERVVALFPIVGGADGFVEAHVVTTDGDEDTPVTHFTVHRVKRNGEVAWTADEACQTLPHAVRIIRKNAGWG